MKNMKKPNIVLTSVINPVDLVFYSMVVWGVMLVYKQFVTDHDFNDLILRGTQIIVEDLVGLESGIKSQNEVLISVLDLMKQHNLNLGDQLTFLQEIKINIKEYRETQVYFEIDAQKLQQIENELELIIKNKVEALKEFERIVREKK